MDDSRTKKIVSEFVSMHTHHLSRGCQYFRRVCPFCEIITREQTDIFPDIVEEYFRKIVVTKWKQWDREAYRIADKTTPQSLLNEVVWHAMARWIQPKYRDIPDLGVEEILTHPYVLQKIRPNI
jgi:predicted HD phosphohydrolase